MIILCPPQKVAWLPRSASQWSTDPHKQNRYFKCCFTIFFLFFFFFYIANLFTICNTHVARNKRLDVLIYENTFMISSNTKVHSALQYTKVSLHTHNFWICACIHIVYVYIYMYMYTYNHIHIYAWIHEHLLYIKPDAHLHNTCMHTQT